MGTLKDFYVEVPQFKLHRTSIYVINGEVFALNFTFRSKILKVQELERSAGAGFEPAQDYSSGASVHPLWPSSGTPAQGLILLIK